MCRCYFKHCQSSKELNKTQILPVQNISQLEKYNMNLNMINTVSVSAVRAKGCGI